MSCVMNVISVYGRKHTYFKSLAATAINFTLLLMSPQKVKALPVWRLSQLCTKVAKTYVTMQGTKLIENH